MLLGYLETWAPFRIDALGLVTMIGASEIDVAVVRLVRNRFTECLPLLGAYIFAGNNFTKPIPGFFLYNISDGIVATDMTGWFARWLLPEFLLHFGHHQHFRCKEARAAIG
ncbi:hypothetical protein K440DRAFT_685659 [Wilcoxina mikolae CBS 423.85]|nr:hypothetical protein K440DRAFT_685659 [Wilcoxina mikolae CBS 423.85]